MDETVTEANEAGIFKHIGKDSPKIASKVILEIADAVHKAIPNPGIYGSGKYKTDNDGSYRAFEKHHYRVDDRLANKNPCYFIFLIIVSGFIGCKQTNEQLIHEAGRLVNPTMRTQMQKEHG